MKHKNKKALIIGVNGQDGKILFDFLSTLDYQIIGIGKKNIRTYKIKWEKQIDINKKMKYWN